MLSKPTATRWSESNSASLHQTQGASPSTDYWTVEVGYAQHAAAAAAYAVRTWLTDDPQEAAWAARQVYDLADFAVLQSVPQIDLNAPGVERELLQSEVIQGALAWIEHALESAETAPQRGRSFARMRTSWTELG